MVTSAAQRLGCSDSVSRVFEKHDIAKVRRTRQEALHIQPLVFLRKLEMHPVALREALLVFTTVPTRLVFKVFGLHEAELSFSLEDARVEAVKEIAVAPLPGKSGRL